MLTDKEAKDLMTKLIKLRARYKETKTSKVEMRLRNHEQLCVEKFQYLVTMRTARYKSFSNYEDLVQEGNEALLKAMKTFKLHKGNAFWWFHKYIDTRISRSANLHTTIRYPLKIAKETPPHKESVMPEQIEERNCPDKETENIQTTRAIRDVLLLLTSEQKEIISLAYGFDGDKPMSVNKICKKLKISRLNCTKTINDALSLMREGIKI